MCRQLGLQLHTLDPTRLPLYDGITGELIPADMDSRVERVRDALLDAARERVDELGEAAVDGELCLVILPVAVLIMNAMMQCMGMLARLCSTLRCSIVAFGGTVNLSSNNCQQN